MSAMLDYMQLCRLCLVKEKVNVPIFGDENDVRQIFLKITACLPVKVTQEDNLPKKICDACLYKVDLLYQFWNTTVNAEKQLIQWLTEIGVDVNIKNSDTQTLPILPQSHAHPHSIPVPVVSVTDLKQERPDIVEKPPEFQMPDQPNLYSGFDNLGYPQAEVTMEVGAATAFVQPEPAEEPPPPEPPAPTPKKRGRPAGATNKKSPPKKKPTPAPPIVVSPRTNSTRRSSATAAAAAVAAAAAAATDSEEDSDGDRLGGMDYDDSDSDEDHITKEEMDSDEDYIKPKSFLGVPSSADGEQPGPSGLGGIKGEATGANATESGRTYRSNAATKSDPSYVVVGYVPLDSLTNMGLLSGGKSAPPFLILNEDTNLKQSNIPIPSTAPIKYVNIKPKPLNNTALTSTDDSKTNLISTEVIYVISDSDNELNDDNNIKSKCKLIAKENTSKCESVSSHKTNKTNCDILDTVTSDINRMKGTKAESYLLQKDKSSESDVMQSNLKKKDPIPRIQIPKTHRHITKNICSICSHYFSADYLNDHIKLHDKNFSYYCKFCAQGYLSKEQYIDHIVTLHEAVRYICFPCNKTWQVSSRFSFCAHMRKHDPLYVPNTRKCKICNAMFQSRNSYNCHIKKHNKYMCDECGRILVNAELLRDHKLRHQGIKPFMCSKCGKKFVNKKLMNIHMICVHSDKRPHKCPYCEKSFKTGPSLRSHLAVHSTSKERPYTCDICNKCFRSAIRLKHHIYIRHEDTRPHNCFKCNKRFRLEKNLERHTCNEVNSKSFTCPECDKVLTTNKSLKNHLSRMHDIGTALKNIAFQCDACGKLLTSIQNLKDHRRIHTGERPFACTLCDKKFKSQRLLHEHRLVHTDSRPYECNICPKAFKSKPMLKKHELSHKK